jgi:crotonobetainyl-CoA:carnitine CoA-transferase CaiB-like acyl-CoA transferase
MSKGLEGIRILDFSRFGAGPFSTALMADLGAEVVRVEDPGGGIDRTFGAIDPNGESLVYKATGRNKKGLTLNLRSPRAPEILKALLSKYDIVVHNIPPGNASAETLSYSNLASMNSRVIVGVVSGFGQTGPSSDRVSFDTVAQAMSGAMWTLGIPGMPPIVTAVRYVDYSSGAILAFSILAAVHHREKTGRGQVVEVALCDVASAFVQNIGALMLYAIYGEIRKQVGNFGFGAYTDCCKAKDGWVHIAPVGDIQWQRFVQQVDRPDMASDPRFCNDTARWENRDYIHEVTEKWVAGQTVDEVLELLNGAKVAASRVNTVADMMEDASIVAREMVVNLEHPGLGKIPIPGVIPKMSETSGEVLWRAPAIGEHNREIYCEELGFTVEQLTQLKTEGVI